MPQNQVRLSTLAEIRVLSIESFKNFDQRTGNPVANSGTTGTGAGGTLNTDTIKRFKEAISDDGIKLSDAALSSRFFKTVGIARQIRVDEQYGTQNIYAIGAPTRPRIIPSNFTANVTCDRIQLDRRNLYDFMATPEYFYSARLQRETGILDAFYYTYLFIKNKEPEARNDYTPNIYYDIYALMPASATKTVSNGDVMISHSVQLTGFKVNYGENSLSDYLSDISVDDITE
jgi:hypothetical protein